MITRKIPLALLLSGVLAGTAAAQTAWIEIEDDALMVAPMERSVDEIEDMDVYTVDGEEIGEVEEVLGTAPDMATAIAIEVGGFLGIGERDVIVPIEQVTLQGDRLILDMTKEEIEALEDWAD